MFSRIVIRLFVLSIFCSATLSAQQQPAPAPAAVQESPLITQQYVIAGKLQSKLNLPTFAADELRSAKTIFVSLFATRKTIPHNACCDNFVSHNICLC